LRGDFETLGEKRKIRSRERKLAGELLGARCEIDRPKLGEQLHGVRDNPAPRIRICRVDTDLRCSRGGLRQQRGRGGPSRSTSRETGEVGSLSIQQCRELHTRENFYCITKIGRAGGCALNPVARPVRVGVICLQHMSGGLQRARGVRGVVDETEQANRQR
jgi:hypothetical protein